MIKIGTVYGDVIEKGGIKNVTITHNYYTPVEPKHENPTTVPDVTVAEGEEIGKKDGDIFCLGSLIAYVTPLHEICKPEYQDMWLGFWQMCIQDETVSASIRVQGKTAVYQIIGTVKHLFFPSDVKQKDIDSRLEPTPPGTNESKYRANLSKKYKLAERVLSIFDNCSSQK